MTTYIETLTTLTNKFTTEQLQAFEKGLISLTIKGGESCYRKDTELKYGEENQNDDKNYISKVDTMDGQVHVNDGDGDIEDFHWRDATSFNKITLLVEESYFDDEIAFTKTLNEGDANSLLDISLKDKTTRDELQAEIKRLQGDLKTVECRIQEVDNKTRELFKL
jgi:hypothetical protein